DLGSQLQDLIARVALVEDQAPIADREQFEARSARAPVQISIATQQIADWLPKLAEQVHQVRLAIEQAPGPWRIVIQEIQVQVQAMLHANFLNDTPWRWLAEFPRYLQAVQARIDKMKNGGVAKDQKLSEPIVAVCHGFEKLRASIGEHSDPAPLVELRWMIEELRVSIFAQQLGTKISVSPKRIQKLIDNLSH
ncbi:MAG: DUF3418 domain-containing protein, partial [Planctomycetales bacterium]|nr:DUF3418 domain-containing protein [Planctomycetales bacterium]